MKKGLLNRKRMLAALLCGAMVISDVPVCAEGAGHAESGAEQVYFATNDISADEEELRASIKQRAKEALDNGLTEFDISDLEIGESNLTKGNRLVMHFRNLSMQTGAIFI